MALAEARSMRVEISLYASVTLSSVMVTSSS